MLLQKEVEKHFAQVYRLKALNIRRRPIYAPDGSTLGMADTTYLWYAQLIGRWKKMVYISMMFNRSYLGEADVLMGALLLGQFVRGKGIVFLGDQAPYSVRLPSTVDPVADALHSMDLLEPASEFIPDEMLFSASRELSFDINIIAPNGFRQISYDGADITSPSWLALKSGLLTALEQLLTAYDNPELRESMNRRDG